jgi:hypothetical protein
MLKISCNFTLQFYGLSLKIIGRILGKVSYILFKCNYHGYNSIYWFKVNLT